MTTPARIHSTQRGHRIVALVVAVLILVQAVLAGRHLFGPGGIALHGVLGNSIFLLGIALVATAVLGPRDRVVVGASTLLMLLLTAQIGLGYAGRESLSAAAWHIPNGVLSFGIAVFLATRPAPATDAGGAT